MKKHFTCILIATTLFSCKKTDIIPEVIKGANGSNTGTNTDTSTGTSTASIKLDIADQVVNTKVSNDTLYLNYTETANLILNADDYQKSSAVHFKEDFSKSALSKFNFTTVNKDHQVATNYLDDNLNNVAIKSASTLTIDGKQFTKLVLERVIIFSKAYKQHDLAVESQNQILGQTGEVISFASYYYTNGKNSDPITATATIVYRK
ncbi:hypothetical protein ACFFGT_22600 [Mucilaginibacter angelicae]|uniref:Lipid/polyisoprenoid-binding YceI-like domain-containing protein n=1 Tax=Mucilaginibacter angelicae TaxID=869718 RepID=A0ABV6LC14_9SPHI